MTNQIILCCSRCPAQADLNIDPKAANGWQVLPTVICAECIETEMAARPTHALIEERSQFYGKVIATIRLVPLNQGRQA